MIFYLNLEYGENMVKLLLGLGYILNVFICGLFSLYILLVNLIYMIVYIGIININIVFFYCVIKYLKKI